MTQTPDNTTDAEALAPQTPTLDDIIRNAEFPDDYDAFEDSMLDMIP